ncbi:MAG: phosphatidate cytidylyltransferase [Candidatus Eisenbacteria bacterium]|nr:phosphatidate cytidylyltransferase [Candidatus Latescibacterota bacterium]MBD3302778.1 phosphatidate cytidylyltransferase [Candidatus Eisenbacteria bacterium]
MRFLSEVRRKAFHLFSIVVPVGYYLLPEPLARPILLGLTVVAMTLDMLRLNEPRIRTFFYYFFGKMVRDHERNNLLGSTYVLLAALLCAYAFERPIAITAMAFLTVGDAAAAVVGRRFGRTKVFGKSLEGSFACFAACLGVAILYPGDPLTWRQMIGGALAATTFELVPMPFDDNMRISLSAGFAMTLLA